MRGAAVFVMLGLAMPASAQIAGTYRERPLSNPVRVDRELGQIRGSIRDGRDDGQLGKQQARDLRRETDRLGAIEARTPDHLSDAERRQFASQREALRSQIGVQKSQRKADDR